MLKNYLNKLMKHWKPCVAVAAPVLAAAIAAILLFPGGENSDPPPSTDTSVTAPGIPITGSGGTLTPITLDISTVPTSAVTAPVTSESESTSDPTDTSASSELTEPSTSDNETSAPSSSATEPPESSSDVTVTEPLSPQPLAYRSDMVSGSESDAGVTLLQYQILYPVFEGSELADQINSAVSSAVAAFEKHAKEELLVYAKQVIKSGSDTLPYRMSVDFDVKVNSSMAVCVTFTKVENTGESRESYERSAVNFDVENGSGMALNSVLNVGTDTLYSMILKQIEESPEKYYEDYESLVRFFSLTNRWYFNETGLVIFFNPYEIAPFDAGIVSFVFPYSELSGMLTLNPLYIG